NARNYKQRPGLVLLNGVVYTSWSSHCDIGKYHGWIIAYDAQTLQQVAVYNNTPNGNQGSFWASGAAPAVDGDAISIWSPETAPSMRTGVVRIWGKASSSSQLR